jgi:hypothetical protein
MDLTKQFLFTQIAVVDPPAVLFSVSTFLHKIFNSMGTVPNLGSRIRDVVLVRRILALENPRGSGF